MPVLESASGLVREAYELKLWKWVQGGVVICSIETRFRNAGYRVFNGCTLRKLIRELCC